jgi:hypothetical protein
MPTLTRRHLLAGAAATAACAAMPAAAIAEQGMDVDRFLDFAVAEAKRLHPGVGQMMSAAEARYNLAWAQAVRSAWLGSGGHTDDIFRQLFPAQAAILDAAGNPDGEPSQSALALLFADIADASMPVTVDEYIRREGL